MSTESTEKTNKDIVIEVMPRDAAGKGVARKIRKEKGKGALIPGNFLKFNGKSTNITMDIYGLDKALANNKEKKFTISLEGKTHLVQLKELQLHKVKRHPVHIDIMPA